jgi:ligand-binding sensor domain-containing protein/signal transduction histidine kinase
MKFRKIVIGVLWLCSMGPATALSQTAAPNKLFEHYQQFVWREEQGLPQNTVQAIAGTSAGYLWLGTLAGVARFDGARFTVFDSGNTSEIRSGYISALVEDRRGALWIGTANGGLNCYRDGRFTQYTTRDGLPDDRVKALALDRDGSLWVGTYGGLARLSEDRFTIYTDKDGLPNPSVYALAVDPEGALWVGTRGGLARFKDGRFTAYKTGQGLVHDIVRSICPDRNGGVWVGTESGLCRFAGDRLLPYSLEGLNQTAIPALYQDREGYLWIGTLGGGLLRYKDGIFARYTSKDGLPGDRAVAIYQDAEGDIWVGTDGGLAQLRPGRFQTFTAQDGLVSDFTWAIYEDTGGSIWVGAADGLSQIRDGRFTNYTARDGLPQKPITAITEDRDGNLWLGTSGGGLVRFKQGRFTVWTTKDGLANDTIYAVHSDRPGNLWVATYGGGVSVFREGRFTTYTTASGLASDFARSIFEDRAGNIWVGTQSDAISRFDSGAFTTRTVDPDGETNGAVLSFYEDQRGSLWIATSDRGLIRFKDEKFAEITVKDGLYDNGVFDVVSDTNDDSGNFWMSCNRGIFRVSVKDLNDLADGRTKSVTSFAYGVADGILSREGNAGSPAGLKTHDGRLWFATTRGVAVTDCRPPNSEPPLLEIEQVWVDRTAWPSGEAVKIRPGQDDLEIRYTGLSWNRPQQIRFRYQLVGLDRDWIDAEGRRTAYYSHLPPGSYTFRIIADNGEGAWNNQGASLSVIVLPPFYRAWWFIALATGAAAGLAILAYQYRVRELMRAKTTQEAFSRRLISSQENERKRIAAELHDSLSQSLVIIKNRAMLSLNSPEDTEHAFEQLDEIAGAATRAIDEVREIAYNLRPFQLDRLGVSKAIDSMLRKVSSSNDIKMVVELDPIDGLISKDSEINLYRIVQESVNNVLKHARATEARVRLRHKARELVLTIQDNGTGFLPEALDPAGDGFGLLGLTERAAILGGSLSVQSAPGQGATVTLTVPLNPDHDIAPQPVSKGV